MFLINIPGHAVSGRYVIVQMDNGEGVHLNLREVMAFGPKGDTQKKRTLFGLDLLSGMVSPLL